MDSNLKRLVQGGTTSRIFDLWSTSRRHAHDFDFDRRPVFQHRRLNHAFLIKHTVRPHERAILPAELAVVTKLIIPVSIDDLGMGGHALFIEERRGLPKLRKFLDLASSSGDSLDADIDRLRELAALPSFDPFLLADRFLKHERPVDPRYFDIAPKERKAMQAYVARQIASVVAMAFGQKNLAEDDERALKFAIELINGEETEKMNALRQTLGMTRDEFVKGMFGWKGVLYYRWKLNDVTDRLRRFVIDMDDLVIRGASANERQQINEIRRYILTETRQRWAALVSVLDDFNHEFERFCANGEATTIRNFLLKADGYFFHFGSDLSALTHVTSYWDYWWQHRDPGSLSARDAMEVFPSFLRSLTRDRGHGVPKVLLE
ncbi:hypothetical protein [Maricaulis maris]|uniref:Uncharacterized protein n=1 Tax=Maricaulis maris TaxID=74318 RepID=A0A495D2Y2_9PROT|nr:hypothetical protein [Maricaulis maris]RKQ96113.1 hypothetical protein C7435_2365 [Maricaulis maris]